MAHDPGSHARLTPRHVALFEGETLFARFARALCDAGTVPRKELYEAWEVARRARRHLRGGRVVDLAAGQGLAAFAMMLLDPKSPEAICVDVRRPVNQPRAFEALAARWPDTARRITYLERPLEEVALAATDVVVSVHACGSLTDRVIERALSAGAPFAVLPCCHDHAQCDSGGLDGWMDGSLAIDAMRVARVRAAGWRTWAQSIPAEVTPKNRLLVAAPAGFQADLG